MKLDFRQIVIYFIVPKLPVIYYTQFLLYTLKRKCILLNDLVKNNWYSKNGLVEEYLVSSLQHVLTCIVST